MTTIAIIVVAVAGATLLAIRRPMAGILLWIALLPVQFDTIKDIGLRFAPADIVLAGLILAAVLRHFLRRLPTPVTRGIFGAAILLLSWLAIAGVRTLISGGHVPNYVLVNKLLGLASLIGAYWMVTQTLLSADGAARALRAFCAIGSAWNLAGLVAYAAWIWAGVMSPAIFAPIEEDRLRGLLVDPNAYGSFLLSVLLVQLCLVARPRPGSRTWGGILNSVILVIGLGLTYSRSAWLALLCGVFALILHLTREERRRLYGPGLAFVVLVLAVSFTSISDLDNLWLRRSNEIRLELGIAALRSFASSPVWGIGLGSFAALPEGRGYIIHSTHLWLLTETGIIGFLLLIHFAFRSYLTSRSAWQSIDHQTGVVGLAGISCLGAWLGLMLGIEALYQRHFWFVCAAVGAACWAHRDLSEASHEPA